MKVHFEPKSSKLRALSQPLYRFAMESCPHRSAADVERSGIKRM